MVIVSPCHFALSLRLKERQEVVEVLRYQVIEEGLPNVFVSLHLALCSLSIGGFYFHILLFLLLYAPHIYALSTHGTVLVGGGSGGRRLHGLVPKILVLHVGGRAVMRGGGGVGGTVGVLVVVDVFYRRRLLWLHLWRSFIDGTVRPVFGRSYSWTTKERTLAQGGSGGVACGIPSFFKFYKFWRFSHFQPVVLPGELEKRKSV